MWYDNDSKEGNYWGPVWRPPMIGDYYYIDGGASSEDKYPLYYDPRIDNPLISEFGKSTWISLIVSVPILTIVFSISKKKKLPKPKL